MSQPANVDILVKHRVRSYRQALRQESVHALIGRQRPQVMSVPGEETLGSVTRSADSDDDVVTTSLLAGRGSGLPVVRGLAPVTTLAEAAAGMTALDFPVTIGQDRLLQKADANVRDDLHRDLRDVK